MDVSPKMVFSVATALIPFLQNDDANRAPVSYTHLCVGMAAVSILVGIAGILVILIGVVKPMRAATSDLMKMITEIDGGSGNLTRCV